MSPYDLGEILKPFVFLDLFDHEGEWMQAGRGMWHDGGLEKQDGRAASSRRNWKWVRP